MRTKKLHYKGLVCVSAVLLTLWIHISLPTSKIQSTSSPHLAGSNVSFPYSNITDAAMHDLLRTGILHEENTYGFSHSLDNRFNLPVQQETTYELPRILHFIWVDGPIKQKYVNSINLFSIHNPNYKVRSKQVNCFDEFKKKMFTLNIFSNNVVSLFPSPKVTLHH